MKLKQLLSIILIMVLLLTITSCNQVTNNAVSYVDDEEDDVPITIYLTEYDILRHYIERYNSQGTSKKIEVVEFKFSEREEMYTRIKEEIEAGQGPDLVYINETAERNLDLYKMMCNGSFADMDVLIENGERFSIDRYNKEVLDVGVVEGTRCFIPLSYSVDYLKTTKESLENKEIIVPDILTVDKYVDILKRCHDGKQTPCVLGDKLDRYFIDILSENKYIEKTDTLKSLLEETKQEYKLWSQLDFSNVETLEDAYDKFFQNDMVFFSSGSGSSQLFSFYYDYNIIKNMYNKEMLFYPAPQHDDGTEAYIDNGIAININSNQKNRAFKFVEYMLLEPVQSHIGLPVNNKAYDTLKQQFTYSGYSLSRRKSFTAKATPMPKEMVEKFLDLIENVDEYRFKGREKYVFYSVINEECMDYLGDQIDFDTLIDNINNNLALYYSE